MNRLKHENEVALQQHPFESASNIPCNFQTMTATIQSLMLYSQWQIHQTLPLTRSHGSIKNPNSYDEKRWIHKSHIQILVVQVLLHFAWRKKVKIFEEPMNMRGTTIMTCIIYVLGVKSLNSMTKCNDREAYTLLRYAIVHS